MQIGPLEILYNDQGVMTSRKEIKNGKCPAGVSGMWCLHEATFGTIWERCTESPASSTSGRQQKQWPARLAMQGAGERPGCQVGKHPVLLQ